VLISAVHVYSLTSAYTTCRRTEELYLQLCSWMVRIESEVVAAQGNPVGTVLTARSKLLLSGLLLANQVTYTRTHVPPSAMCSVISTVS